MRRYGLDSSVSDQGPVAGSCEHNNESSGSIQGSEILKWLSDCQLPRYDSAPQRKKVIIYLGGAYQ